MRKSSPNGSFNLAPHLGTIVAACSPTPDPSVKRWLNAKAAEQMTVELLREHVPDDEQISWRKAIRRLAESCGRLSHLHHGQMRLRLKSCSFGDKSCD